MLIDAKVTKAQVAAVADGADLALRHGTAELMLLLQERGVRHTQGGGGGREGGEREEQERDLPDGGLGIVDKSVTRTSTNLDSCLTKGAVFGTLGRPIMCRDTDRQRTVGLRLLTPHSHTLLICLGMNLLFPLPSWVHFN